ncbi:MAG: hypothetical protein KJ593_07475 [Candidatus Omnitrophica bacterium]|nr:hypothetical protein [Candidatus Omnitrophota bacterium]
MESKLEKVMAVVERVKADCEELERKGELTERGRGQLDVVKLIEDALKD